MTYSKVVYPPDIASGYMRIFLAGSIEMNTAERWQDKFIERFQERYPATGKSARYNIFNPRRKDWDNTITEKDPIFKEQVNWELENLMSSHIVFMNICSGTKSPITLLEFGLLMGERLALGTSFVSKLIICCPDDFWRRGNIETTLEHVNREAGWNDLNSRSAVELFNNFEDGFNSLMNYVRQHD